MLRKKFCVVLSSCAHKIRSEPWFLSMSPVVLLWDVIASSSVLVLVEAVRVSCVWSLGSGCQWFVQTVRLSQVRNCLHKLKSCSRLGFFPRGNGEVFLPLCTYLQTALVNSIPCYLRSFMLLLIFVCEVPFLYMHLFHSLFLYALDYISTSCPFSFGAFKYKFWLWHWRECTLTSPGWFLLREILCVFLIWWSLCSILKHKTSVSNFPGGKILTLLVVICFIQVLCWRQRHTYKSCKGIFVVWFPPLVKETLKQLSV